MGPEWLLVFFGPVVVKCRLPSSTGIHARAQFCKNGRVCALHRSASPDKISAGLFNLIVLAAQGRKQECDARLHPRCTEGCWQQLIYRGLGRCPVSHRGPGLHSIWVMLPGYVTRICAKVCFLAPFMS